MSSYYLFLSKWSESDLGNKYDADKTIYIRSGYRVLCECSQISVYGNLVESHRIKIRYYHKVCSFTLSRKYTAILSSQFMHWSSLEGSFALDDNDMLFVTFSCRHVLTETFVTMSPISGNMKILCRCRQVRTVPDFYRSRKFTATLSQQWIHALIIPWKCRVKLYYPVTHLFTSPYLFQCLWLTFNLGYLLSPYRYS